jgi:integrase/recombinase XerC
MSPRPIVRRPRPRPTWRQQKRSPSSCAIWRLGAAGQGTFAGITYLGELAGTGRDRLHANVRSAWGAGKATTFNARRAAVGSAVSYFHARGWTPDAGVVLAGLEREYQPKPDDSRVRSRGQIDQLVADDRHSLQDRTLWALLYATAARATEVLGLDIGDLDRAARRARTHRKGGKRDTLLYDLRTAQMLDQLLGTRAAGPLFLSTRPASAGTPAVI